MFKEVKNASFLRQQLLNGNTEFEYAFLDAGPLLSRNHVLAACFRSINDMLNDRLKSRNVHSEIVFSLSPNNNVSVFHRIGRWCSLLRPNAEESGCDSVGTPNLTVSRLRSHSVGLASRKTAGTLWRSKSAVMLAKSKLT